MRNGRQQACRIIPIHPRRYDVVALFHVTHVASARDYDSSRFVAQKRWGPRSLARSNRAAHRMNLGVAHAAGKEFYQNLVGSRIRKLNFIDHQRLVGFYKNRRSTFNAHLFYILFVANSFNASCVVLIGNQIFSRRCYARRLYPGANGVKLLQAPNQGESHLARSVQPDLTTENTLTRYGLLKYVVLTLP